MEDKNKFFENKDEDYSEKATDYLVYKAIERGNFKKVDYQKCKNKDIQSLIKSKESMTPGRGKPEFVIQLDRVVVDVIFIECKATKKFHQSLHADKKVFKKEDLDKISSLAKIYAVDGVLHYMTSVMNTNNCIGVAVSGQDESSLEISTFISKNGEIFRLDEISTILNESEYRELMKRFHGLPSEEITNMPIHNEFMIKKINSFDDLNKFIYLFLALQINDKNISGVMPIEKMLAFKRGDLVSFNYDELEMIYSGMFGRDLVKIKSLHKKIIEIFGNYFISQSEKFSSSWKKSGAKGRYYKMNLNEMRKYFSKFHGATVSSMFLSIDN